MTLKYKKPLSPAECFEALFYNAQAVAYEKQCQRYQARQKAIAEYEEAIKGVETRRAELLEKIGSLSVTLSELDASPKPTPCQISEMEQLRKKMAKLQEKVQYKTTRIDDALKKLAQAKAEDRLAEKQAAMRRRHQPSFNSGYRA